VDSPIWNDAKRIKREADAKVQGVHFQLIESVADHICETLFVQDARITRITVKIVKLAISENGEEIGMTLTRNRRD
jgi:dihydroneopterin aldolase